LVFLGSAEPAAKRNFFLFLMTLAEVQFLENTQNQVLDFARRPEFKNLEHDVSETGSVSVFM
jgi:hypothetical protein